MIDRIALGDFLRRRRAALVPSDLGLPDGVRRRTAGLRRDEVALAAGISSDYYARLEQNRGANPSESVITGLARSLRLDDDERDHVFRLAGFAPPTTGPSRHISPGLLQLLDRLPDVPTMITTDLGDVLVQNTLATVVLGDLTGAEDGKARPVNLIRAWFTDQETRDRFPVEDWAAHSAAHVRDLRATTSRRGGETDVATFVAELVGASGEFRQLWEQHDVGARRSADKRIVHPEVGLIDLRCEVMFAPDHGLQVVAFFPVEATGARRKLDLLHVIGLQSLPTSP